MKSFRKFVAVLLLLWTPLFFSGAAYAATQMELSSTFADEGTQMTHSCHQTQIPMKSTHPDIDHHNGGSNVHHCGFCVGAAIPLNELATNLVSLTPALAFSLIWVPSSHNNSPEHRPPIDA